MRWCTVSSEETAKCTAFKTPLEKLANDSSLTVNVSCVQGESAVDCMKKIQKGDADLITLDGGEIYLAGDASFMASSIPSLSIRTLNN